MRRAPAFEVVAYKQTSTGEFFDNACAVEKFGSVPASDDGFERHLGHSKTEHPLECASCERSIQSRPTIDGLKKYPAEWLTYELSTYTDVGARSAYADYLARALDGAVAEAWHNYRIEMNVAADDVFDPRFARERGLRDQGLPHDFTALHREKWSWIDDNCNLNLYVLPDGAWKVSAPQEAPKGWLTFAPVWSHSSRAVPIMEVSEAAILKFERMHFEQNIRSSILYDYSNEDDFMPKMMSVTPPTPVKLVYPHMRPWPSYSGPQDVRCELHQTTIEEIDAASEKSWAIIDASMHATIQSVGPPRLHVIFKHHLPEGVVPLAYYVNEVEAVAALMDQSLEDAQLTLDTHYFGEEEEEPTLRIVAPSGKPGGGLSL